MSKDPAFLFYPGDWMGGIKISQARQMDIHKKFMLSHG